MSGFTLQEWINESPQVVFEALADESAAPLIMPNIKSMTKLTPGDVGVGTKFREIRVVNGKEETTDLEVIAFDKPNRYGVAAEQSGVTVAYYYQLQPKDEGTEVKLECTVTAKGVKKLMTPVVASIMKKEDGDHLNHFKQYLEKQAA